MSKAKIKFIETHAPAEFEKIVRIGQKLKDKQNWHKANLGVSYPLHYLGGKKAYLFGAENFYNYYLELKTAQRLSDAELEKSKKEISETKDEYNFALDHGYGWAVFLHKQDQQLHTPNTIRNKNKTGSVIKTVATCAAAYTILTTAVFFGANQYMPTIKECPDSTEKNGSWTWKYPKWHAAGAEFLWDQATRAKQKLLPNNVRETRYGK
ncbi:MAG: hypothetical protein FWC83_01905 [Alphaproteobacteria bacterium]|nr:hypothetical protein [Alphaproteobacteria bacterium]